jgi:hypothetical protein
MNDREVISAALRWHTAHEARLAHTTASNRFKSEQKKRDGFGGSEYNLSQKVTAAKRVELAALRKLAKACQAVRTEQERVADADVIDVPARLTYTFPVGE